jgi:hypothetical protein
MARSEDLKQDPLVDRLRRDPSEPPAIERRGFLGRSEKEGFWRLYLTKALARYVEIAESDIVYQKSLATTDDPDAGSCIWIKETAILIFGPPAQTYARNLDSAISCCYSNKSWEDPTRNCAIPCCTSDESWECLPANCGVSYCSSNESWDCLPEKRVIEPAADLINFFMVPFLPWAIAARFWTVACAMFESGFADSQLARIPASDLSSYRSGRRGKVIRLSPREYKVLR